jgi:diguanylate cyclase (GGDEF)-like protein
MERDCNQATRRCAELALGEIRAVVTDNELELLMAVRQHEIDLALVHLEFAEAVGTDLPDILRRVSPAPYLPVVVLAEDPVNQRCPLLKSGADEVIGRDVGGEELAARLESLLRIKDLNDRLAMKQKQLEAVLTRERLLLEKLKRDNAELREQATTDPLTHLQNRRSFASLLAHEFNVAKRYNHPLSLLALDVDHFKVVNDEYGHPSGDYVLKELAVILKQSVRQADIVARTGGEEFSIILPRAGYEDAETFAQRIRRKVYQRQFRVYGRDIHATVSLGAATYPVDAEITSAEMLVHFADQALLNAKETGRDRVVQFHQLDLELRRRCRRQHQQLHDCAHRREICTPPTEKPVSASR